MEDILREIHQDYEKRDIWISKRKVIEKVLSRPDEMKEVYEELSTKLTHTQQIFFWDAVLSAAAFWTPEASRKWRDDRLQLEKLNKDIAKSARKLASQIKQRYELSESSEFFSYNDSHVANWIECAAEKNYMFEGYVQEEFHRLSTQYDSRYWPRTYEVIEAVAKFAEENNIEATNEWTEELLSSPKCSKADYLRVLYKAIDDYKADYYEPSHILPKAFKLTDNAMATLMNCSLDLSVDDLVTKEYIKRCRQSIRQKEASRFFKARAGRAGGGADRLNGLLAKAGKGQPPLEGDV